MIFRCTAHFYQSFDALDEPARALTLRALAGFNQYPRVPSHTARIVQSDSHPDRDYDIWCIDIGPRHRLTYSFLNNAHPDHHVCVLRHVGRVNART